MKCVADLSKSLPENAALHGCVSGNLCIDKSACSHLLGYLQYPDYCKSIWLLLEHILYFADLKSHL